MFVTSLSHVLINMKNVRARLINYCRCSCTLDVLYFWSVRDKYRFNVCTAHNILACSLILIKLSSIYCLIVVGDQDLLCDSNDNTELWTPAHDPQRDSA